MLALLFLASSTGEAAQERGKQIILNVTNPTPITREEVLAVPLAEILRRLPTSDPKKITRRRCLATTDCRHSFSAVLQGARPTRC